MNRKEAHALLYLLEKDGEEYIEIMGVMNTTKYALSVGSLGGKRFYNMQEYLDWKQRRVEQKEEQIL